MPKPSSKLIAEEIVKSKKAKSGRAKIQKRQFVGGDLDGTFYWMYSRSKKFTSWYGPCYSKRQARLLAVRGYAFYDSKKGWH